MWRTKPETQAELINQEIIVLNETVNSYTHNFTMQIPRLVETVGSKGLSTNATGRK